MIGTLTTKTALGPRARWTPFREKLPSQGDLFHAYANRAEDKIRRLDRLADLKKLRLYVGAIEDEGRRRLFDQVSSPVDLDTMIAAMRLGMPALEQALESRFKRPPDTQLAVLEGPWSQVGYGGLRECHSYAVAVGEQAYVRPIWSSLERAVSIEDGHVSFIWRVNQEGSQNCSDSDAHSYAVVFHPDGKVEEFRSVASSGPRLMPIDGKMFSVRPHHWNDPSVEKSSLDDRRVAVWNGLQGPELNDIRYVVKAGSGLAYIGYKGSWNPSRLGVIVRHPDRVLYEGPDELWCRFSKTPEANPIDSTVYGVGPRLLALADGSVIWALKRDKAVTVYRDERPVVSGDLLGFYRHEDGLLTVIERTRHDRRNFHVLGHF